jgi:hypothetical protein
MAVHDSDKAAGRRTTVYRLTGVDDFRKAVRAKYLDHEHFAVEDVMVGGRPALLVSGAMTRDSAGWCAAVFSIDGTRRGYRWRNSCGADFATSESCYRPRRCGGVRAYLRDGFPAPRPRPAR